MQPAQRTLDSYRSTCSVAKLLPSPPPIAQGASNPTCCLDGLVRISLKRAYADARLVAVARPVPDALSLGDERPNVSRVEEARGARRRWRRARGRQPPAAAYCRLVTCARDGSEGSHCDDGVSPDNDACAGIKLRWPTACTSYSVLANSSKRVSFELAHNALVSSFEAWTSTTCEHGKVALAAFDFGTVTCDQREFNQTAGNANVLMFFDDGLPDAEHMATSDAIARTWVTYDPDTGEILDADIEVDSQNYRFTDGGDDPSAFDLQSVLTHEVGHFLGMAHSPDPNATMRPSYAPSAGARDGNELRHLTSDDERGICAAYPPGPDAPPASCSGIQKHGFSPDCGVDQTASCALAPGAHGAALHWALGLACVAALRRRRRA